MSKLDEAEAQERARAWDFIKTHHLNEQYPTLSRAFAILLIEEARALSNHGAGSFEAQIAMQLSLVSAQVSFELRFGRAAE